MSHFLTLTDVETNKEVLILKDIIVGFQSSHSGNRVSSTSKLITKIFTCYSHFNPEVRETPEQIKEMIKWAERPYSRQEGVREIFILPPKTE